MLNKVVCTNADISRHIQANIYVRLNKSSFYFMKHW